MQSFDEKRISTCPDEETMSRLAEGKVSEDEREALLIHIAACKTCSTEFYLLRKLQPVKITVRKKSKINRNVFQLIAAAAMVALIIGFTGHDVLDRFTGNSKVIEKQEASKADLYESEIPADAPSAPTLEMVEESDSEARRSYEKKASRAKAPASEYSKPAEEESIVDSGVSAMPPAAKSEISRYAAGSSRVPDALQKTEKNGWRSTGSNLFDIQEAPQIYEVVYNGHDGDESEVIGLLQQITGRDEESTRSVAKSSSIVIRECASMEEAQGIKEELESIGAKIEIIRK
jgi:ribosomal protein L7/L12